MINEMYVHTCNSNVELIAKPIVMPFLAVTKPMVLDLVGSALISCSEYN